MTRLLDTRQEERLIAFRRRLHQFPELSNQEFKTTAAIRDELSSMGLDAATAVDPAGLVLDIGSAEGPTVAVRGDIDALPLQEESGLPFASRVPGQMHACGHDIHTSCVLGVAMLASAHKADLPGRLRLIFQPAEEYEPLGARAVIEQGHLDGVDAIIGLHVDPSLEVGRLALRSGAMMSGSDVFVIEIDGENTHAGWPHEGRDALAAAVAIVNETYVLRTREIDPRAPLVLHFGTIDSGSANNIVAGRARLEGVIRTLDQPARESARRLLERVVDGVARTHGVTAKLDLKKGEPILENDPRVTASLRGTAIDVVGAAEVVDLPVGTLNGEDFSFYLEHVPGAMAWLGVRNEEQDFVFPLHHPRFGADERAIAIGARVLFSAATNLLKEAAAEPGVVR